MLDPFVLINMNGRIYDPVVARVLSPDNFVADPFSTQDFNRYSYGYNNPLKYTDPDGNFAFVPLLIAAGIGAISGYLTGKAHGAQGWGLVGYTLGGAAIGGFSAGLGEAVLASFSAGAQSGLFASSIGAYAASGAAAGFVSGGGFSLLNGGSFWEGAWKGGLIGGLSGALVGTLKYDSFVNSLGDNLYAQGEPIAYTRDLAEVTVRGQRLIPGASQVQRDFRSLSDYLASIRYAQAPLATGAVEPLYWETNFIPIFPKASFVVPRLGAGSIREITEVSGKSFSKISDNLLKKLDIDAHQIKRDFLGAKARISQYDLYKHTQTGEILILQKGGKGFPIQTGEFIR